MDSGLSPQHSAAGSASFNCDMRLDRVFIFSGRLGQSCEIAHAHASLENGLREQALPFLSQSCAGAKILVVPVPRHRSNFCLVANHELNSFSELNRAFPWQLLLGLQEPYVANNGPGCHESNEVPGGNEKKQKKRKNGDCSLRERFLATVPKSVGK
jgi:hypothetical protein